MNKEKLRKFMVVLQMVAGAGIVALSITVAFSGYYYFRDLSVLYANIPLGSHGSLFVQSASLLYLVATATGFILFFYPFITKFCLKGEV